MNPENFQTLGSMNSSMVETNRLFDLLSTSDTTISNFYNIDTSTFGSSKNNPFFKIKAISLNRSVPYDDRMRAIRYMDRIPHKETIVHTIESCMDLLDDDTIPIGERYFFFSNNEAEIKLSGHVHKACHEYFFKKDHFPLLLRLNSANFIYTTFEHTEDIWKSARELIIDIAIDEEETVHLRSEAADILLKRIVPEDGIVGRDVIRELGLAYSNDKLHTIYSNAQNVHDDTITESVMGIIRSLVAERNALKRKLNMELANKIENKEEVKIDLVGFSDIKTSDILERIYTLISNEKGEYRDRVRDSFNAIIIHQSKYEGITLSEIMNLVWGKIVNSEASVRQEMERRFVQELYDMDKTCGSGLCSRLVNVLSGYVQEEHLQIKMSVKSQLRSNVFARLKANLKMLSLKDQENIAMDVVSDGDKETVREFVEVYSVKDELHDEFVVTGLIGEPEFNTIYDQCIKEFIGDW